MVYGICKEFSLTDEQFLKGLRSYQTLPHRLQYLGIKDGIRFYDDSISTIGETTIQALESIKNAGSILIGGMDRGVDYDQLEEYLAGSSVKHIILMEATGKRIYSEIEERYPTLFGSGKLCLVDHLKDAVELAGKLGEEGSAAYSHQRQQVMESSKILKSGEKFLRNMFSVKTFCLPLP